MKLVMGLKIAAQLPFSFLVAISLSMSAYEILNGNFSEGLWSLSGAVFFGLVLWFAWNDPFGTGGKLVFGGFLFLVFSSLGRRTSEDLVGFTVGGSFLISGLLLMLSSWATPKDPE